MTRAFSGERARRVLSSLLAACFTAGVLGCNGPSEATADPTEAASTEADEALSVKNRNLRYFGFYDEGDGVATYGKFANVVVLDPDRLAGAADALRREGVKVIVPVGDAFYACRPTPANPDCAVGKPRVFGRRTTPAESAPPEEWTQLAASLDAYQDLVIGLYDLDEPAGQSLPPDDLEWAEAFMHASVPWAKVMVNYGVGDAYAPLLGALGQASAGGGPTRGARLPSTADWIAFDANAVDGSLASWGTIQGAVTALESLMQPNQQLWLVAPTYGTTTHSGPAHDAQLAARAAQYFGLANGDRHVAGVLGWPWARLEAENAVFDGLGATKPNGKPLLPKTLAKVRSIGKSIKRASGEI